MRSMTGFGTATFDSPTCNLEIEARSVNNRHLKVVVRGSDPYPTLESEIEKRVRAVIRRGSVTIHVRAIRPGRSASTRIDPTILREHLDTLRRVCTEAGELELLPQLASGLLSVPGIIGESQQPTHNPEEWTHFQATLDNALAQLNQSRGAEGETIARELLSLHETILGELDVVNSRIPMIVSDYRTRLHGRIEAVLAQAGVTIEESHLIREVALYADRTDVAEELSRLRAHLDQFAELCRHPSADEPQGRRLEFVVQEIGREVNTLGSKVSDATASRHVIAIKATLETIRELILNVD